ncbi:uncharacterized protein UV8b_04638 [Ustilaginoidea virens]|uniref:ZZ-type domain-containing protein n=1 Tax=Ustilaginoidea virens TaxID=1159556 RepID=A0A8E5HRZ0_USTVR|nr:uncharacterized protein UV8b_04638 [Ustilaginoidea virens]QUC20397.1 hypothetical protein UV8b_04638 [Ustilaginoidea virens]
MSSVSYPGSEALVSVKVTYDGGSRRVKMPLREMVPHVLEKQIRVFLQIPADSKIMIERYSDSAAAFVMLDASNMSVYKQLYRAAKAKSKLKLRVSLLPQSHTTPAKPAAVEDAPETVSASPVDKPMPDNSSPIPSATASSSSTSISRQYDANLLQEAAKLIQGGQLEFDNRLKQMIKSTEELTSQLASCQPFTTTPAAPWLPGPPPLACPASRAMFAVCCNSCENNIPGAHYHCSTCDDGDFDLCQDCVEGGVTCRGDDHWLIKRTVNNGQIVNSTTETLAPKPKVKSAAKPACSKPADAITVGPPSACLKPADDITVGLPSDTVEEVPCFPSPAPAVPADDITGGLPSDTAEKVPASETCFRAPAPSVFDERANEYGTPPCTRWTVSGDVRTCNQCVRELPEHEFLHCTTCEDYDLCQPCFAKDAHGHHPKHGFAPAVPGTPLLTHVRVKMNPGRNQAHHAICDGCETYVTGIRHKCLDCPDWDYCTECAQNADFVHPGHRFAPIYEPLTDVYASAAAQPVHMGICCDGPLCSSTTHPTSYIRGIRYKCAVCHDLDFCANCEASPANDHNKTHPLIKFKTPVRHVSVTTSGERQDGKRMPAMGDRLSTLANVAEWVAAPSENALHAVRTVVDVQPVYPTVPPASPAKEPSTEPQTLAAPAVKPELKEEDLRAVFLRDSVADGTLFPPNHVFEQTWVLRNEGTATWPAGCSVKFVGGDYMGHVDSAHPAGISELVSASESTICYAPLAPGQEFAFTTLLRTPTRPGKMISYWRLTTPDGLRFGHRLWCEVNVRPAVDREAKPKTVPSAPASPAPCVIEIEDTAALTSSMMIFPKLDKESPTASMHQEAPTDATSEATKEEVDIEGEDDDWDASEGGFMTDEEYDILDASDEEFLEEQQKRLLKN